jgi:hypothetical protein
MEAKENFKETSVSNFARHSNKIFKKCVHFIIPLVLLKQLSAL